MCKDQSLCEWRTSFDCKLGVRQGECLSQFLFAMYVSDKEQNQQPMLLEYLEVIWKYRVVFWAPQVLSYQQNYL